MEQQTHAGNIWEAAAIFFECEPLQNAVDELDAAGFAPAEVGLLAGEYCVRQKLGHLYTEVNASQSDPDAPPTTWVRKQSMGDTVHALLGALVVPVSTTAAGVVVATAGIFGGALAAAVSGTAALLGTAAIFARFIDQSDAEFLEQQVEEGHMLLFVRVRDAASEIEARKILSKYSPLEVKVYGVPAEKLKAS